MKYQLFSNDTLRKHVLLLIGAILGLGFGVIVYFIAVGLIGIGNERIVTTHFDFGNVRDHGSTECEGPGEFSLTRYISPEPRLNDLSVLYSRLRDCDSETLERIFRATLVLEWTPWLGRQQLAIIEHVANHSPSKVLELLGNLRYTQRQVMLQQIVQGWTKQSVESLLNSASETSIDTRRQLWNALIEERDDLSHQLAKFATTNGFKLEVATIEQQAVISELRMGQPEKAFELLTQEGGVDVSNYELLLQVVEQWSQEQGIDLLDRLDASSLDRPLFEALFAQVVSLDRVGAVQRVMKYPKDRRTRLGLEIVELCTTEDLPEFISAIDRLPVSLYRTTLLRTAYANWASRSPRDMIENIANVPRNARASNVRVALSAVARTNPSRAFQYMEELQSIPSAISDQTSHAIVDAWSSNAPVEALTWVNENVPKGSEVRLDMMRRILAGYARIDPTKSMQLAILEKENIDRHVNLELIVIDTLIHADRVDDAIKNLKFVGEDSRDSCYLAVGRKLAAINRTDEIEPLIEQYTDAQKVEFYASLTRHLSHGNTSTMIAVLTKIQSKDIQSQVARDLIDNYSAYAGFTERQTRELESFISD